MNRSEAVLTRLVTLVGIFFQIRDDYQNLASAEVSKVPMLKSKLMDHVLTIP